MDGWCKCIFIRPWPPPIFSLETRKGITVENNLHWARYKPLMTERPVVRLYTLLLLLLSCSILLAWFAFPFFFFFYLDDLAINLFLLISMTSKRKDFFFPTLKYKRNKCNCRWKMGGHLSLYYIFCFLFFLVWNPCQKISKQLLLSFVVLQVLFSLSLSVFLIFRFFLLLSFRVCRHCVCVIPSRSLFRIFVSYKAANQKRKLTSFSISSRRR